MVFETALSESVTRELHLKCKNLLRVGLALLEGTLPLSFPVLDGSEVPNAPKFIFLKRENLMYRVRGDFYTEQASPVKGSLLK